MGNTLITASMIAKEALRLLENNLVFARGVSRKYEKEFSGSAKTGGTVNVRKRAKFTVRDGATASLQDVEETQVPVTIDTQKGVDVAFTSKELALSLQDFSEQFLEPAVSDLANAVDYDLLSRTYKKVPNFTGAPGTLPSAMKTYALGGANMDNECAPQDAKRSSLLTPLAQVELIDAQKALFQSASEIKSQYERGRMGVGAGFDFAMSQNLPVHTVGALGGTPAMNGSTSSGADEIVTDGWTAAAANRLKEGDIIQIAGVYAVNPKNKQSTGVLRTFVVTADVASDGSGNATIPIYPAIVSTGKDQNVNALPADGALITVFGHASSYASKASPVNLQFHKEAATLVTVDLPLPKGMDMASRISSESAGLSIRFVRGFDITNDKFISRLDVLYGYAVLYPEWMNRVQG